MAPATNIALGARQLAYWRDVGGLEKAALRPRRGALKAKQKYVRCTHKTHAYWAHYNHGKIYLDHGRARHYPHRVAVLYYALLRAMNLDTSLLTSTVLSVRDPGKSLRTAAEPVEPRYRKLCNSIRAASPTCGDLTTAHLDR